MLACANSLTDAPPPGGELHVRIHERCPLLVPLAAQSARFHAGRGADAGPGDRSEQRNLQRAERRGAAAVAVCAAGGAGAAGEQVSDAGVREVLDLTAGVFRAEGAEPLVRVDGGLPDGASECRG